MDLKALMMDGGLIAAACGSMLVKSGDVEHILASLLHGLVLLGSVVLIWLRIAQFIRRGRKDP